MHCNIQKITAVNKCYKKSASDQLNRKMSNQDTVLCILITFSCDGLFFNFLLTNKYENLIHIRKM